MTLELCAGAIILICIILIIFFLHYLGDPISFEKKYERGESVLTITTHKKIDLLEVVVQQKGGDLKMIRSHLKNNEKIVFSYPSVSVKAVINVYFGKESRKYEA